MDNGPGAVTPIRTLAPSLIGALVGGALVYGVLSYKHSSGPFVGDRGQGKERDPDWAKRWARGRPY